MTKEEFILNYCRRSDLSAQVFARTLVALPCTCEQEGCNGWAAVAADAQSIAVHQELYGCEQ